MNMKISKFNDDTVGQLYTLEGAATAIMMIILIAFVVKASPLTPLTSSSSHQQVEAQLETRGTDLLVVLDYALEDETYSKLNRAVIDWGGVGFRGQYPAFPGTVNQLATQLNQVFLEDGTAYNMEIAFLDANREWRIKKMFWNGEPSDNSVLVTRKIVIHDADNIKETDIPDLADNTEFYNIVDVRLTLWRM
ncbi:MAG: hypothetical protein E4G94_09525 [ANME-2 cluster archaeon]|nr:MAG: hypothetical protein E4G94_09525 [ANME-2 cluster archaeon]